MPGGLGVAGDDRVSRRRQGKIVWTEVDADPAREPGKTAPGSRDCADARPDPTSRVDADVRIVYDQTSQLRLIDRAYLAERE